MPLQNQDKPKIFISHASADKDVAKELVKLLKEGFSLGESDIVCTSVEGHGLRGSTDYYPALKSKIEQSETVIYLLSKSFCKTPNCLYEVAWRFEVKTDFAFHIEGKRSNEKPEILQLRNLESFDINGLITLKEYLCEKGLKSSEHSWHRALERIKKYLEDNPLITTAKEQTGEYFVPISGSVKQKLDSIKELPQIYRDACLAESLGLVFHPDGYSAYLTPKMTELGVNYYPVREGSLFVDSLGDTHNFLEVFTRIQKSDYKEKWWNAKRHIGKIGLKNIIHYLGDSVEEVCKQTAANRLASITDTHFRDSVLAIIAGLLDCYIGQKWEKNIPGTDEKYEMTGYCIAAAFYDSQGNVGYIESSGENNEHTPFYGARETILICCHWGYEDYVLSLYQREVDKMQFLKETRPPARSQRASN